MADLDTRDKRASGLGVALPTLRLQQNPSGTIAAAGRQFAALCYVGVLASAGWTVGQRASVVGIDLPWMQTLPVPDGTISAGDRQHLAHKYALASAPAAPTGGYWIFGDRVIE